MRMLMPYAIHRTRTLTCVCAALFAAILLLAAPPAQGQSGKQTSVIQDTKTPIPEKDKSGRLTDFGSPESEIRSKLIIKEEKKKHGENLARVGEVAQIATQIRSTYEAKHFLSADDFKRLERLEKLTKRVRNEAGGSETDLEVKDLPVAMLDAVKRMTELADDLRKEVEKTPRQVVSAGVIDRANKLIGVVQYVRKRPSL